MLNDLSQKDQELIQGVLGCSHCWPLLPSAPALLAGSFYSCFWWMFPEIPPNQRPRHGYTWRRSKWIPLKVFLWRCHWKCWSFNEVLYELLQNVLHGLGSLPVMGTEFYGVLWTEEQGKGEWIKSSNRKNRKDRTDVDQPSLSVSRTHTHKIHCQHVKRWVIFASLNGQE